MTVTNNLRINKLAFALVMLGILTFNQTSSAVDEDPSVMELPWPPKIGERYPDLELLNAHGETVRLASLAGQPMLVHIVGMTCPACNGYAGGNTKKIGPFPGMKAQGNLKSTAEYLPMYSNGIRISDKRLQVVTIIYFGRGNKIPQPHDAQQWAEHFGYDKQENHIVLIGQARHKNNISYKMVPGFHIIDQDFTFVSDASGHNPRHKFYDHSFPLLGKLVRAAKRKTTATSPADNTAASNAWVLKDGTTYHGKFFGIMKGKVTVKTDSGEWQDIPLEHLHQAPEAYREQITAAQTAQQASCIAIKSPVFLAISRIRQKQAARTSYL